MKQKLKTNKGITLIALILTIIVLLILAVVAINAVKGDGIIAHAKSAKADYSRAQTNEQDTLSGYELMLAQETGNAWKQEKTKVIKGNTTLNVGDEITNFTAGGKTWKVLGAENGKLLLTTENAVTSKTISGDDAVLGVWDEATSSYKNAEDELNKLCVENISLDNLTDEIKSKVTEVRSIKVEDINRVTGYDPKTAENGKPYGAGNVCQYGNEVTYSVVKDESGTVTGVKYESKNVESKSGTSTTFKKFWAPNTSANITSPYTVTSTYYGYAGIYGLEYGSNAYQLLFGEHGNSGDKWKSYYLASSWELAIEECAAFNLHSVQGGNVNESSCLWYSYQGGSSINIGVRPVVSLASDFQPAK